MNHWLKVTGGMAVWVAALVFMGCNGEGTGTEEHLYSIPVEGQLTVDHELDATGDYSGIEVRVLNIFQPETDTLYHAVTDSSGWFADYARFSERGEYLLEITRGGNEIAETELILAEGDTIRIEAELPEFDTETVIDSREHEAMQEFNRLTDQFTRVSVYINAGLVDEEEALEHLHTWNELFRDHAERHAGTLAGDRAMLRSVGILDGWDEEKMFEQLASDPDNEALIEAGLYHGVPNKVREGGLDEGLSYLEELRQRTQSETNQKLIDIHRIEMLFDSARVERARSYLEDFKSNFGEEEDVREWISGIDYDLEHLAPGMEVPDFTIPLIDGDTVAREAMQGSPFVIEFVNFESPDYQFAFPELSDMYDRYRDHDLRVITIPTHDSRTTIQGFFSERERKWSVADAGVYSEADLIETFNVDQIPVRLLVDTEGRIVRKYYQAGVQELESDLSANKHQPEIL